LTKIWVKTTQDSLEFIYKTTFVLLLFLLFFLFN